MIIPVDQVTMDLSPEAILDLSPEDLEGQFPGFVKHDHDDLDYYVGISFLLDYIPVILRKYRGHPDQTTTVYLDLSLKDHGVGFISDIIERLVVELKLNPSRILWQRKHGIDGPEWNALLSRIQNWRNDHGSRSNENL